MVVIINLLVKDMLQPWFLLLLSLIPVAAASCACGIFAKIVSDGRDAFLVVHFTSASSCSFNYIMCARYSLLLYSASHVGGTYRER